MIKLEKVNKYFYRHKKNEIHVIDNTSIELNKNGLVSLLGPSGCGKTTLLNVIGGLDKVNKGKIYVDGKKITNRSVSKVDKIRNLNIGYIFQDYNLIENMTVYDNVALSLRINGIKNSEEIKKRVTYVLEKVDMYKYRNRLASMLSGGQRQRVGIARAIVKDPKIIIADEPTGNLDSKNTIEVMNIIKAISKNRLVILVTHEKELAEFYSDRILEIEDGKIVKDRKNEHNNELDYKMDSRIYLKDFKIHDKLNKDDVNIDYYGDTKEKINIDVVVTNGNIFIRTDSKAKTELVDDKTIELIDDHYKKISKEETEKYVFDLSSVANKKYKYRYSSIFGPFSLLAEGFRKVRDYSFVKKLLLIGFFASGMFITYSISSLFGINRVNDAKFIEYNKNYVIVETKKTKVDTFKELENDEDINYVIPSNSMVNLILKLEEYYQTKDTIATLKGSLSSINMINKDDLSYGRMPSNNREIVIDKMLYDKNLEENSYGNPLKSSGIIDESKLIGKKLYVNNDLSYEIVGITNLKSPSVYVNEKEMINMIALDRGEDAYYISEEEPEIIDYKLTLDDIKLKKGKYPVNDYEVIVHYDKRDEMKLKKKISYKVNDTKLKVVGYFTGSKYKESYLVSNNTIKYNAVTKKENVMIYPKNKEQIVDKYKETLNIKDSYEYSKDLYLLAKKDEVASVIKTSVIFLVISLIEIYLMMRSSFLSRIKEVGIYRAIGVKKKDIYKMFTGEILSITTFASLVGVLLMMYILKEISFIDAISDKFQVDLKVLIVTIAFVYAFNLLVGLLPVYMTIRKTPAQILSRSDI